MNYAIGPVLRGRDHARLADDADICQYLVAADVMIADHSSAGFESTRIAVAQELFYRPGSATLRAARELYALMELECLAIETCTMDAAA